MDKRAMANERAAGKSDAEIGRARGVSRQTIRFWLGPSGQPPGIKPKTTPEQVATLAKQRLTDQEIADRFGLSPKWVGRLRNQAGIKYPRRGRTKS